MRRESSTVVAAVGEVGEGLLDRLGRAPNVSVARARATEVGEAAEEPATVRPGWEAGAAALREAARRQSTYVVVPDDPLADVAQQWRTMWEVPGGSPGAAGFEQSAAGVLAAWRAKQFELPDYYLVMAATAQPGGTGPDLYLGPLRSARPRRVAVVGSADSLAAQAARVLDTLSSLAYGPWWPPLDELLGTARHFYAGGLAETQPTPA